MKLTTEQVLTLLYWINSVDKLRIEKWFVQSDTGEFVEECQVFIHLYSEDEPFTRAKTNLEALIKAEKRYRELYD